MVYLQNRAFLSQLLKYYEGFGKGQYGGSVWVTIKKKFPEVFQHKRRSLVKKKRQLENEKMAAQSERQFSILVRAKTLKRKISTLVEAKHALWFESQLQETMRAGMLGKKKK